LFLLNSLIDYLMCLRSNCSLSFNIYYQLFKLFFR